MTEIKKSFKSKMANKKRKIAKKMGSEFGAIIQNNPENYTKTGEWKDQIPVVSDKCLGCGKCVELCPEGAIEIKIINGKKRAVIDYSFCKGCGICAENCPIKAIKMKRKK